MSRFKLADRNTISDSQITAMSFAPDFEPSEVRLSGAGWCSESENPTGEYLQINLQAHYKIEIIVTKGRLHDMYRDSFVKSYYLQHSIDGMNWTQPVIANERRVSENIIQLIQLRLSF